MVHKPDCQLSLSLSLELVLTCQSVHSEEHLRIVETNSSEDLIVVVKMLPRAVSTTGQ